MEGLRRLADRLDQAAATVGGSRPADLDPGHAGGGAGDPGGAGLPDELATTLRRQVTGALQARQEEAAGFAADLGDLAARLRVAAGNYHEAEEAARTRHARRERP